MYNEIRKLENAWASRLATRKACISKNRENAQKIAFQDFEMSDNTRDKVQWSLDNHVYILNTNQLMDIALREQQYQKYNKSSGVRKDACDFIDLIKLYNWLQPQPKVIELSTIERKNQDFDFFNRGQVLECMLKSLVCPELEYLKSSKMGIADLTDSVNGMEYEVKLNLRQVASAPVLSKEADTTILLNHCGTTVCDTMIGRYHGKYHGDFLGDRIKNENLLEFLITWEGMKNLYN